MKATSQQPYTDNLEAGYVVTVTPDSGATARVTIDMLNGQKTTQNITAAMTFGPYFSEVSYRVEMLGGVSAAVVESVAVATGAVARMNAAGNAPINPVTGELIRYRAGAKIVATMGDSMVWNGLQGIVHIKSVVSDGTTAVLTITETSWVTNSTVAAGDAVDIAGLEGALAVLNGTQIPITARDTGNNTISVASTLTIAATGVRTGATASSYAWRKIGLNSVFGAVEAMLGDAIYIPRTHRLGWGGGGFSITGDGYQSFSEQCRRVIKLLPLPDEVWVHYGTNDAAGGKTLAQMQVECMRGLRILQRGGIEQVRIDKIWPRVQASLTGDAVAKAAIIVAFNAWLDSTVASSFVKVINSGPALQDTSLDNYQPYYTANDPTNVVQDGLHPSFRGGIRNALDVIGDFEIAPMREAVVVPFVAVKAVPAITDISGTMPDAWPNPAIAGSPSHVSGVGSIVLAADAESGVVTVTVDLPTTERLNLGLTTLAVGTDYEPNTIVQPKFRLELVSATTDIRMPFYQFTDTDGTNTGYSYFCQSNNAATDFIDPTPFVFDVTLDEYKAKVGSTSMPGHRFEFYGAGVGNPFTFKISSHTP